MSGRGHDQDPGMNVQIAGESWTAGVLRLCEVTGHKLQQHEYDRGVPGQYHACHAEKQLIAFYISRHLFLPHKTEHHPEDDMGDNLDDFLAGLALSEPTRRAFEQLEKEREHREELFDHRIHFSQTSSYTTKNQITAKNQSHHENPQSLCQLYIFSYRIYLFKLLPAQQKIKFLQTTKVTQKTSRKCL